MRINDPAKPEWLCGIYSECLTENLRELRSKKGKSRNRTKEMRKKEKNC